MDGASLHLQSVPALFCKPRHTNGTDGSGNGNVFLTDSIVVAQDVVKVPL